MNILSIDTTTKTASVALQTNNNIIEKTVDNEITHSEKLLPLIDSILKKQNLNINDIEKYIVLNGPGSFTGVRIGLATVKAFAMVNKKQIISISSLEAIAISIYMKLNTKKEKYILSLIDARNDRVYYGLFKVYNENSKIHIQNESGLNNDLIENVLDNLLKLKLKEDDLIIAGNCINSFKELILNKYHNTLLYNIYPTTTELIKYHNIINNLEKYTFDTYTLDANYVRPSQAERIKNEQNNK